MTPTKQKALAALSQYEDKLRRLSEHAPLSESDAFLLQKCAAMVLGDILMGEWRQDGGDFSQN